MASGGANRKFVLFFKGLVLKLGYNYEEIFVVFMSGSMVAKTLFKKTFKSPALRFE
jgi:hypothetical protein